MRCICTSIVATLVLALAGTTAAHADITYSVNTDGSGDYTTLSAAVTAGEASGDTNITINVAGGPYNENIAPASGITWTFTGQTNADGTPATTINMADPGEPLNAVEQGCVTLPGGCTFTNFAIQSLGYPPPAQPCNCTWDSRICLILNGQGNTVSNCKFIVDATGAGSFGILFPPSTSTDPVASAVSNCMFVSTGSGGEWSRTTGIIMGTGGDSTVDGCTFTSLDLAISIAGRNGAALATCDDAASFPTQISNCTITGNYSGGSQDWNSCGITWGLWLNGGNAPVQGSSPFQLKITDTTITDCFFGLGSGEAYMHCQNVDVVLDGVTVENCHWGMAVAGGCAEWKDDPGVNYPATTGYTHWLTNTTVCSNTCQVWDQGDQGPGGPGTCLIQDGTEPLPSGINWCGGNIVLDDDCASGGTQAACCTESGCMVMTRYTCEGQGGMWLSAIDSCTDTTVCQDVAACCTSTGCTDATPYECSSQDGTWNADGSSCTEVDSNCNPAQQAACCLGTTCTIATQDYCEDHNGTWHETVTTCAECNLCNNMDGVCCSNGICVTVTHPSDCDEFGGVFIPCGDCTTADCSSTSPVSTINVPGDYSSIADAITAASDGNVIQIGAGTFSEGNINPSGKAITIQGTVNSDGSLATTIDGSSLSTSVFRLDSAEGTGTVIKDLILTSGNGPVHGGGIFCGVGTSPVISNCVITDCSATELGGGIHCQQSNATIAHCIIKNNSAPSGGGISCKGSPSPSIAYCTIMRNTADTGSGVYSDNSDPVMTGSTICQNTSSSSQVSGTWTDGGSNDICCPGDTNGDGVIDIEDLLNMLGNWGPCP